MRDVVLPDVEAMRRGFDARFTEPLSAPSAEGTRMLALSAGEVSVAVRLSEMAGLFRCPEIASVPSASGALLGLVGLRGALVAVFDLAVLLGQSGGARPVWLALLSSDRSVGLAFTSMAEQFEASPEDVVRDESGLEVVTVKGRTMRVLRAAELVRRIREK